MWKVREKERKSDKISVIYIYLSVNEEEEISEARSLICLFKQV